MRYLQLVIRTEQEHLPQIKDGLEAAGFDEMIINDPSDFMEIEEHPEWYKYDYINEELAEHSDDRPEITLFFSDDEEGRSEAERVAQIAEDTGFSSWDLSITEDDSEWLYKWQEHFKPTKAGERIVVKPNWESYDARPGEIVIEMDPGMAFGSGLHETTTLCIKALERYFAAHGMAGKVLDVGCGTGILAIAAAMLGADECLGIDIDPDAVRTAEDNIKRNGLSNKIRAIQGDLTNGVGYHPDILVANLMADLVIRLAPAAAEHLSTGGVFISSGILDVKAEHVADAVQGAGFSIEAVMQDGEWCAIVAKRV